MTTKWTPPPWAFDTTRGIYAMRPSVGKNLPFTLATTFKRPTREEEEANGKIMAAAPELAEALAARVEKGVVMATPTKAEQMHLESPASEG